MPCMNDKAKGFKMNGAYGGKNKKKKKGKCKCVKGKCTCR